MFSTRRSALAAALLAMSALALSGCGSAGEDPTPGRDVNAQPAEPSGPGFGSDAGDASAIEQADGDAPVDGTVYTFDDRRVADDGDLPPFVISDGPVAFELPDDLRAAAPEGKTLALDGVTLSASSFPTGLCRVDGQIAWADGGYETLSQADDRGEGGQPALNAVARVVGGAKDDVLVDELPSDEGLQADVTYVLRDGTAFSMVDECSEDPEDSFLNVSFEYIESAIGSENHDLATAWVAVLPGTQAGAEGSTLAIEGDVRADVSVTGKWVAKS